MMLSPAGVVPYKRLCYDGATVISVWKPMSKPSYLPNLRGYHLTALSLVAIINLREYPILASMGWQAVAYSVLAFFGFLLPSAWVCAELAGQYPSQGGLYTWFQKAFGDTVGCLGMAVEWINNLISFPATLAMMIATLMTVFLPSWQHHILLFSGVTLGLCWLCVSLCCCGLHVTNRINVVAAVVGIVLPTLLIIALGIFWIVTGHEVALSAPHVSFSSRSLFHLGLFVSVLSAYAGMQSSAFFAPRVKHPERTYPKALLLSAVVIFFLMTGSALSIAIVVPASSINYVNGLIASFQVFFAYFHLKWLSPCVALMMVLGAFAAVCTWMQALARGVHQMALEGKVPAFFCRCNSRKVPVRILILQGSVISLLIGVFLCVPDAQTVYWLFVLLTSQFTVLMYIGLFAAAIKLLGATEVVWKRRLTHVLAGLGIVSSVVGLSASFSRPDHIIWSESTYVSIVAASDAAIAVVLMLFLWVRVRRILSS